MTRRIANPGMKRAHVIDCVAVVALCLGATGMTVTRTQDLQFGSFASSSSPGFVRVTPAGIVECGGGVACLGSSTAKPAIFQVSGATPGASFTVSMPASIQLSNGSQPLTVHAFTDSLGGTGVLNAAGDATFSVGATLDVNATQAQGSYSGSFEVTINYQ